MLSGTVPVAYDKLYGQAQWSIVSYCRCFFISTYQQAFWSEALHRNCTEVIGYNVRNIITLDGAIQHWILSPSLYIMNSSISLLLFITLVY